MSEVTDEIDSVDENDEIPDKVRKLELVKKETLRRCSKGGRPPEPFQCSECRFVLVLCYDYRFSYDRSSQFKIQDILI